MGNWTEIFKERSNIDPSKLLRDKYLKNLAELTGRNVIAYYSGFLQHPEIMQTGINDLDMNAFMTVVNTLDKKKGLDLILHTPGGDIAATENIVRYLKSFFCGDIRAIIPQISMSAGTMTACACKEILMGKQSNLGPIDPQTRGIPCQGVIEEFKRAIEEVKKNPDSLFVWQTIINKYPPTFIGECQKAIEWSQSMVTEWLENGMFAGEENAKEKAEKVSRTLSSHEKHKTHNRHLLAEDCLGIGLKIKMIESNQKLQDAILSVHHAFMISLDESNAPIKIVENNVGSTMLFNKIV
ncbi:SDH family Clp fold serine proteinase [uncultured Megamonas sp.]|uniref:SDH family Clp fold serine proteinase n=1 Tax=uncultured Megamonas sp. TaxID=286140 RepID=UPI00259B99B9|nr:hypothetical protein [uncultured Megamonas sp.]